MLWLLMEAEFLAIVLVPRLRRLQLWCYSWFVVMMLDINVEKLRDGYTGYLPLGVGRCYRRDPRNRSWSSGSAAKGCRF